jgi:hypothetical protein
MGNEQGHNRKAILPAFLRSAHRSERCDDTGQFSDANHLQPLVAAQVRAHESQPRVSGIESRIANHE